MQKNIDSRKQMLIIRQFKILEISLLVLMFAACWMFFYEPFLPSPYSWLFNLFAVILYGVILLYAIRVYRGYAIGNYQVNELAFSQGLAEFLVNSLYGVILLFLLKRNFNILPLLILFLSQLLLSIAWTILCNKLYFKITPVKKTIIIYETDKDLHKILQIRFFKEKYDVIKTICSPHSFEEVRKELVYARVIFVWGIDPSVRNEVIKHCISEGKLCYVAPKIGDVILAGAEHMQMFGVPVMRVRRATIMPEYVFFKRTIDILGSILALIITSPLLILTAVAIKLDDHGPVLYRQTRLTKDKKLFTMLKLRSMKVDAEKDGIARRASENDVRITKIGRFIRACRIDELPQLFNILKGDMSIVGPRPERPEIIEQHEKLNSAYDLRLQVKAGLTGYAQVYGYYNTDLYDKLQLDLVYINNLSIKMDCKLMIATIRVLFLKESTEGIKDNEITVGD